jgi:hypothetical protein
MPCASLTAAFHSFSFDCSKRFRDLLHAKYKSSTKAKRKQRLLMKQGKPMDNEESDEEGEKAQTNTSVEAKIQQISRTSSKIPSTPSTSTEPANNHCLKTNQQQQQGNMHEEVQCEMKKATHCLSMHDTSTSSSTLSSSTQYPEPINLECIDFEEAMNGPLEDCMFEPEQQQLYQEQQCQSHCQLVPRQPLSFSTSQHLEDKCETQPISAFDPVVRRSLRVFDPEIYAGSSTTEGEDKWQTLSAKSPTILVPSQSLEATATATAAADRALFQQPPW